MVLTSSRDVVFTKRKIPTFAKLLKFREAALEEQPTCSKKLKKRTRLVMPFSQLFLDLASLAMVLPAILLTWKITSVFHQRTNQENPVWMTIIFMQYGLAVEILFSSFLNVLRTLFFMLQLRDIC